MGGFTSSSHPRLNVGHCSCFFCAKPWTLPPHTDSQAVMACLLLLGCGDKRETHVPSPGCPGLLQGKQAIGESSQLLAAAAPGPAGLRHLPSPFAGVRLRWSTCPSSAQRWVVLEGRSGSDSGASLGPGPAPFTEPHRGLQNNPTSQGKCFLNTYHRAGEVNPQNSSEPLLSPCYR